MAGNPERWRRVEELCDRALALSPDARPSFLRAACESDEGLRRDVESLLAQENRLENFLAADALEALAAAIMGEGSKATTVGHDDLRSAPGPATFAPNDLLSGRFRIVGLLGAGGMGEVYEAEDLLLGGDHIALKTLPAFAANDERAVDRLKREIAAARRVTHPNVCRVFDADQHQTPHGPITFFTMELLRGETLAGRLGRCGRLDADEARSLLRHMAAGLGAAHAADIVHGDFKPSNVILVPGQRGGERAVVTDFGLARQTMPGPDASRHSSGVRFGTPAYMAPEQREGKSRITPASDIYALGVVAYEMLTGRVAVAAADAQQLDAPWRTAIATCLDREPGQRFKSAIDFVHALDAPVAPRARTLRWSAGVAGVLLLALLGMLVRTFFTPSIDGAAVAPNDRIVAVLPFTVDGAAPESQAYGRGLAASLTDDLRFASALEGDAARVLVIPAAEVLEVEVRTAKDAQRLFSATILITGRLEGDAITVNVEEARDGQSPTHTQRVASVAGSPILAPAAVRDLARQVGVTLSPRTLQALDAHGSAMPKARELYVRGKGQLTGPGADFDAAANAFQRAIQLDGRYAMAHAALGDAYLRKYRATLDASFLRRAQASADEAIALASSVAYAHVIRGRVYQASGQNERAVRELQTALGIDPAVVDARRGLAEIFEAEGDLQAAEDVYRQEIAASPHYFAPHVNYGSFLIKRGRYREAETSLVNGMRYAPDNSRAIGNLAGLYIFTERLAAAETELKRGLALKPDVVVCNNLAWVQIYQGKFPEAVQFMEQAVRLPFADSFHWGNLARVYRWAGRPQQAQSTYRKAMDLARQAIDHNPRDARIRGNFAQMLAETGQGAEALAEITTTLERAPRDVSVLFRSALVHELTGDRAAALRGLEAAVRGGYSVVDIRRHPDLAQLRGDPRFVGIMTLANKPAVN